MGYIFSTRKKDFGMYLKMMLRQSEGCTVRSVSREHLDGHIRPARNGSSLIPTIMRAYELSIGKELSRFQTVLKPSSARTLEVGKRIYTKICLVNLI